MRPLDMILDASAMTLRSPSIQEGRLPLPLPMNAEIAGRMRLEPKDLIDPRIPRKPIDPSKTKRRSTSPAQSWGQFTLDALRFYEDIFDGSGDGEVGEVSGAMGGESRLDEYSSMDTRMFGIDAGDMMADSDEQIAYFRILKRDMLTGIIDNQNQIFPKSRGETSINEEGGLARYKKMIVLSYNTGMAERAQIMKSNTMLHVYFFDNQYETITIQGALKTSWDDPWDTAMVVLWDQLMRGTQLVRRGYICEFGIGDKIYWGYPIVFQLGQASNSQYVSTFSMNFLIVERAYSISNVDDYVKDVFEEHDIDTSTNYQREGLELSGKPFFDAESAISNMAGGFNSLKDLGPSDFTIPDGVPPEVPSVPSDYDMGDKKEANSSRPSYGGGKGV